MTAFQELSSFISRNKIVQIKSTKVIQNTWLKIELRSPTLTNVLEIIKQSKDALSDAYHVTKEGEQDYFDELVNRDLAS